MTKNQLLALAAFITSLANDAEAPAAAAAEPEASPTPAKRRGRPPTTPEPPAVSESPEPPAPEPEAPAPTGGKTYEGLRELIRPLVEGGKGAEVKAEIAKFATDLKALAALPQHHAAFEKNLEALSY